MNTDNGMQQTATKRKCQHPSIYFSLYEWNELTDYKKRNLLSTDL